MKTKANTLIEDGQDVVVKDIKVTGSMRVSSMALIENMDEPGNNIYVGDDYIGFTVNHNEIFGLAQGVLSASKPIRLAQYETAQRPTPVNAGDVIYDITLKKCILYNGTAWVNLDGTALS